MRNLNVLLVLYSFSTFILVHRVLSERKSYCEFREDIFRTFYNLTKLSKRGEDIILNHEYPNETIRMQLCSTLIKQCNGKEGYSICLIRKNKEIGIGKTPPNVTVDSGKILLAFTGDDCDHGTKYQVDVIMKCDYSIIGYSIPEIFPHTDSQCHLYMVWKTVFACANRTQVNCMVIDHSDGSHYDLSPLKSYSNNYEIHMGNNTSPKIIFNVCHSVIFEYGALCYIPSGACLQDPKTLTEPRYLNLGDVQKPLYLDPSTKNLKLEYENGGICRFSTALHIRTTITFICDMEAINTLPEYTIGSDECHYELVWKTVAACSLESLRRRSASTAGICSVTNPLTNFTYNLQSLMNKDFVVKSLQGLEYTLRVCGPTVNICKTGTGVCLKNNNTSLGMANTNVIWRKGGPYLNYTDGDMCKDGKNYETLIAFFCGSEKSSSEPIVMEEYPCQLIIHWNTDLACEKTLKCAVVSNDEINLTPLIRFSDNYSIKINNTVFLINVCRPVVPMSGLTCSPGSAVCKASVNSRNEYVNETSLGFPKENPQLKKDGQIILRYLEGSVCPENSDIRISSTFLFLCDDKNEGTPEYKEYKNCTYVFEWRTRIACGSVVGDWISPCLIKDRFFPHQFDLSLLSKNEKVRHVKSKNGNNEYNISICEGQETCNGSTVCRGNNAYGLLTSVLIDYNRNIISLVYTNGSKCSTSPYMSKLRLICNESIGIGEPKLFWESPCAAEFEWYTNVTCIHQSNVQTSLEVTYKEENVQSLSSTHIGVIIGVIIAIIVLFVVLFYYRNPERRACLHSYFDSCISKKGSGRVQYCRVNTTEEARLLLDASDPTQCQSDSDDDLLGV